MKKSNEIRDSFLEYFRTEKHTILPSASLVPIDDPTILFTNAGMNQFKDLFLGLGKRNYNRAANSQKCIRVSGKHNDLEEVGYDAHHHTFFEMLGNWSFGDYYKDEAIGFAWKLITEVWKIPKEHLWATVYNDDDESEKLWLKNSDLKTDRILRFGASENFWEMGETGPCGPCSELFIDLGKSACPTPDKEHDCSVNSCDRFREFWNLVFIQYNRDQTGKLHPLPQRHVDTGMGFERMTAIIQGVDSNYKTDIFTPLLSEIANITAQEYFDDRRGIPHRVLADHVRCLTFAIGDGVLPSSDGRGYVIRRILRRATLYGKKLGMSSPFLFNLVDRVIDMMEGVFTELTARRGFIKKIVRSEEVRFYRTLDNGLEILTNSLDRLEQSGKSTLPGIQAFELYDTFGFPLDLTQALSRERSFSVDEKDFNAQMAKQKARSRTVTRSDADGTDDRIFAEIFREHGKTDFLGYGELDISAEVLAMVRNGELVSVVQEDDIVELSLDRTPFYGESGGQVGDRGIIESQNSKLEVLYTWKPTLDLSMHKCRVVEGELSVHSIVAAKVDADRRQQLATSHTATHILHSLLRSELGTHVGQSGSLVEPGRLRFDFTHFESIDDEKLSRIEELANEKVRRNDAVDFEEMKLQEAKDLGAMAFFGEKYGEVVRVVKIGDYSVELCGGTHVNATGEIGTIRVSGESSIAAGVRRIEALTANSAFQQQQLESRILKNLSNLLKTQKELTPEAIEKLLSINRELEREIRQLRDKTINELALKLSRNATELEGIPIVSEIVEEISRSELLTLIDKLKNRLRSAVIIVASASGSEIALAVGVTKDLVESRNFNANKLIKGLTSRADGRGGGRPELAQGAVRDRNKLEKAMFLYKREPMIGFS